MKHAGGNIAALKKAAGGDLLMASAGVIGAGIVNAARKSLPDFIIVRQAITTKKDFHSSSKIVMRKNRDEVFSRLSKGPGMI